MGYASVLWLDERPVRAALGEGADESAVAADLGAAVLRLADGSYGAAGAERVTAAAAGGATVARAGTFHSTGVVLLQWTGADLVTAPLAELDALAAVDRAVPAGVFVNALGASAQSRLTREALRHPHRWPQVQAEFAARPLAEDGAVSFWWVHHDAVRPGTDPAGVGAGMLALMRTHLGNEAKIGAHSNGLGKLGTLLDPARELAFAWWGTAAWRLTTLLDSGESWTARFGEYVRSRQRLG